MVVSVFGLLFFFFFKQKTAYEISSRDWSSDVCSSDLMLLQPMVENCLKHGLAPKLGGGKIELRTTNIDGRLRIEIEDNGVGISEEKMPHVYVEGIGLSNVRERLRVLYGTDFHLDIESRPGEGTVIRIEIPELVSTMQEVR